VESVEDAYKIASEVGNIKQINLGGVKARENSRNISKAVNLLEEEENLLKELQSLGIEIEIRQVANDNKVLYR
ncbi:PTS sugar transporter subunit IIB, partial [Cetobacterium somerae]